MCMNGRELKTWRLSSPCTETSRTSDSALWTVSSFEWHLAFPQRREYAAVAARISRMLPNAYLLAKIGFDTAEKAPVNICNFGLFLAKFNFKFIETC